MQYLNARVMFKPKEINNKFYYGFHIIRDGLKCEIFTLNEEIYLKWKELLSYKLILLTFHEDFEVKKMIGKGSFAKVIFHNLSNF